MLAREVGRPALAALSFLTRIPVGRAVVLDGEDVARAVVFFPGVGALIGAAVAGAALVATEVLPTFMAAALAVAFGVALTGALHVDALADTADGLGGTTRERALEIMRDHTIGAYGASALVLDMIVRVAAVAALIGVDDGWRAVIVAGALSRAMPGPVGCALPYARSSHGSGSSVTRHVGWRRAATTVVVAVAIALTLQWPEGIALAVAAAIVAGAIATWSNRRLGGVTGDTIGAAIQLSETAALVVAVALT